MSLNDLRTRIDEVDAKLVELLNERSEISIEVGRRKANTTETRWFAPEREREIFQHLEDLREKTSGAIGKDALHAIYREILSSSRALQKQLTIAYWGPAGSYTHMAATSKFGSSSDFLSCNSILEVFSAVEHTRADYGVIPVENSVEGVVHYTLDSLQLTKLKICAEIYVPITHNLLTTATELSEIQRVYTGPQPLGQCRNWLGENLPGVEFVEIMPTTRAVERATGDPEGAAIASVLAAEIYSIPVRVEHIEDDPRNTTRFLVVGENEPPPTGRDKTSVLFAVRNEPGGLARALCAFEDNGVNLSMITSRPSKHTPWDYVQFVDLQGHERDDKVNAALEELKTQALFVSVLGSYPEA
ncbi:MAG: prephenate dehydratase [Capsulimonadaceae bacterium]|nr:prephenate dehydratase [Capsulimonadaceae bacterium]